MGLWGAAQAVAFGLGGVAGTIVVDLARRWLASPLTAYDAAFIGEALLFVISAAMAARIALRPTTSRVVGSERPLAAGT